MASKKGTNGVDDQRRHLNGRFAKGPAKREGRNDLASASASPSSADLGDLRVGPGTSQWEETAASVLLVDDWEDRLQCAEALNETLAHLPAHDQERVAYLSLEDDAQSGSHYGLYVTAFDRDANIVGAIEVPDAFLNTPGVPEDFRPHRRSTKVTTACNRLGLSPDRTVDVAKIRAYDWDGEQAEALARLSANTDRALARLGV